MSRSATPVSKRHEPPPPPRTVKPNGRTHKSLPIVAVGRDSFLAESGETGTLAELIDKLPNYETTLFCTVGAADLVTRLNQIYLLRYPGTWQVSWNVPDGNAVRVGGVERAVRVMVAVNYFGWNRGSGGKKGDKSVYHQIIDPVTMYQQGLDDIWPELEGDPLRRLLKWATTLRDFCAENNLKVKPTLGGISAQALRNPKFYPDARRKVPAKINQRARENLPGNHYFLNVKPNVEFPAAYYLDQKRAHHYHARHIPLPDSNHCYAYGAFADLGSVAFPDVDSRFMGLYCLDLDPPAIRPPYDWVGTGLAERITSDTLREQFVYSNELPHLLDCGYRVRGVRAAWGSVKRDYGLLRYAEWAESQLDRYGDPVWLKLLLHATYGCLATRPMTRKTVYRLAKRGEPTTIRTGRNKITGLLVESPRKLEPGIAHVIQRGMIEAATRSESIGLAQWLDHQGHTVLSIYADAVIVEADDDRPLPELIFDPWRCKAELTHLQYYTAMAFRSDQMTKLPGVPIEVRNRELVQVRGSGVTSRKVNRQLVGELTK